MVISYFCKQFCLGKPGFAGNTWNFWSLDRFNQLTNPWLINLLLWQKPLEFSINPKVAPCRGMTTLDCAEVGVKDILPQSSGEFDPEADPEL